MIGEPQQGVLPFKIEQTGEPLIARAGLVLPYEKAEAQRSYQKEKGYQPLLGFLFELGLALGDEFRDTMPAR